MSGLQAQALLEPATIGVSRSLVASYKQVYEFNLI